MRVCHVGTLPLEQMGTQTRTVFQRTVDEHVYAIVGAGIPGADVYVLECFKKCWEYFRDFKPPASGAKIVSWVHSSAPCAPAAKSDAVVCSTHYSAKYVLDAFGQTARVIPYGLDVPTTGSYAVDGVPRFGCIIRNTPGKFHPRWGEVMGEVLKRVPESYLMVVTQNTDGLLLHERAAYRTDVRIDDQRKKFDLLSCLSVAVFAHGDFEEVFPMAVLECMAVGLPVVYLYQPSMHEMVGESQSCCDSVEQVVEEAVRLLQNPVEAYRQGIAAKDRVERCFPVDRQVAAWDLLLEGLCA